MARRTCRSDEKIIANCKDFKINTPQLPWGHKSCASDISNCIYGEIRPFSRHKISKWKNNYSYLAIIPTNSRPVPQPRKVRVTTRALPQIDPSSNCWEDNDSCYLSSTNGGLIDPNTGYFVTQGIQTTINQEDYLEYNNPDIRITIEGKIACEDEEGLLQTNFYSGPGWKQSRVHNKKIALARPIKHWRKQLLPRQYIDSNGNPRDFSLTINSDNIDNNISRRGRSNVGVSLFETPGSYFPTNIPNLDTKKVIQSLYNNQISCIPIYINDSSNVWFNSCNLLNQLDGVQSRGCNQKSALLRARPGANVTNSDFQFQGNKAYLQARVRLEYQTSTFSYNPYMTYLPVDLTNKSFSNNTLYSSSFPPSTISLYLSHKLKYFDLNQSGEPNSCWSYDCSCAVAIAYKPRNIPFQRNSAVTARNNIRRKSRIATNRNQYNITNSWGVTSKQDSLYTKCNNYRTTLRGTYNCPLNI